MKDQYFGDFGDYQKLSLLRKLRETGLSITTHWMKTLDDGSTDGKHITYLAKPELWRSFEPDIFDFLSEKVASGPRTLRHIEESDYCSNILFINDYIEDTSTRSKMLDSLSTNHPADMIFFDPDNGIEVASTNKKNAHKYVSWDEISKIFDAGKSVIVYQHFSRSNRDTFIDNKVEKIKERLGGKVISVKVRHSVYFFVLQNTHEEKIALALEDFGKTWRHLAQIKNH